MSFPRGARTFVPEVIQTSSMDCGVASVKALLEGFHIRVSYGRLREACQTDVDGTSIDVMESLVQSLGLDADQIMLPADHVALAAAAALPAIAVVRLPNGFVHFVVLWRRHGALIQVMDPGRGRGWRSTQRVTRELYIHETGVEARAWRAWSATDEFLGPLRARMGALDVSDSRACVDAALQDGTGARVAHLDAAVRMLTELAGSRAVGRGRPATRLLQRLLAEPPHPSRNGVGSIPARHWFARYDDLSADRVTLAGAVLVRVRGVAGREPAPATGPLAFDRAPASALAATLSEPEPGPFAALGRLLTPDSVRLGLPLMVALAVAAIGVIGEAVLLRSLIDVGRELTLTDQRLMVFAGFTIFLGLTWAVDLLVAVGTLAVGRRLETRVRIAFLRKLPRVADRFLHSRLMSDMAERCHSVHRLRQISAVGAQAVRLACELAATATALFVIDPGGWPVLLVVLITSLALPLAVQRILIERDLRVRSLGAALSRCYFDALQGLLALRTHGAERGVRREHETLLAEWVRASLALLRADVGLDALQTTVGFALAIGLVCGYANRWTDTGVMLLLVYWALNLPILGQELAHVAQQSPSHRNIMLRLLELLTAPEEHTDETGPPSSARLGMAITMRNVVVRAGGHTLLDGVSLEIPPGAHVAIVGGSGAGKSTLVHTLLGWHAPASGELAVDGTPADRPSLAARRRETAWLDPGVHLWNASLLANLTYGKNPDDDVAMPRLITDAELQDLLRTLPEGLQTVLGEGGGLVSGGEGQRVRFGRALTRPDARLVILDEPFRGLPGKQRCTMLARARACWKDATLLCITHDVAHTLEFDRVIVVDAGTIVEDGAPSSLAAQAESRYRRMLDADASLKQSVWADAAWRRLRMEAGRAIERPAAAL